MLVFVGRKGDEVKEMTFFFVKLKTKNPGRETSLVPNLSYNCPVYCVYKNRALKKKS